MEIRTSHSGDIARKNQADKAAAAKANLCLCGHTNYKGGTLQEASDQVLQQDYKDLKKLGDGVFRASADAMESEVNTCFKET